MSPKPTFTDYCLYSSLLKLRQKKTLGIQLDMKRERAPALENRRVNLDHEQVFEDALGYLTLNSGGGGYL